MSPPPWTSHCDSSSLMHLLAQCETCHARKKELLTMGSDNRSPVAIAYCYCLLWLPVVIAYCHCLLSLLPVVIAYCH